MAPPGADAASGGGGGFTPRLPERPRPRLHSGRTQAKLAVLLGYNIPQLLSKQDGSLTGVVPGEGTATSAETRGGSRGTTVHLHPSRSRRPSPPPRTKSRNRKDNFRRISSY